MVMLSEGKQTFKNQYGLSIPRSFISLVPTENSTLL